MWNDLTMQQRADVISMAVKSGLRDMDSIRNFYDESVKGSRRFGDGGDMQTILNKVNSSKANFVSRLKDPNRKYIRDWESDKIATHKLGVGTDDHGNHYIYPEVQEINGRLIDFTRPPYAPWVGQAAAEERGDTVRVPSIEEGIRFTENYKRFYPKGNTFGGE